MLRKVSCSLSTKSRSYSSSSISIPNERCLAAELILQDSISSLKRRNPSFAAQKGTVFVFGGFTGKEYLGDLSVIHLESFPQQVFPELFAKQLVRFDSFCSTEDKKATSTMSPTITIITKKKKVVVSKYDLCLRFNEQNHWFVQQVKAKLTWDMTKFDADMVLEFFEQLLDFDRRLPSNNELLSLQDNFTICRSDLIPAENFERILHNMHNCRDVAAMQVSIEGDDKPIYCDLQRLCFFSEFFKQFSAFSTPRMHEEKMSVSMPARFKLFLELVYRNPASVLSSLSDEQLIGTAGMAEYLLSAAIKAVTSSHRQACLKEICLRINHSNIIPFFLHFHRECHKDMLKLVALLLLSDRSILTSLSEADRTLLASHATLREEVAQEFSAILGLHQARLAFTNCS